MVQVAPAATVAQLLVCVKDALASTVSAIVPVVRLVTVKVFGALVVPTAMFPNDRDAGLMVTGVMPVPETLPVTGLPKPS
jgi:hypothetical protein